MSNWQPREHRQRGDFLRTFYFIIINNFKPSKLRHCTLTGCRPRKQVHTTFISRQLIY